MTSIAIRAPMLCIALLCAAPAWCMAAPGQQQATEATEALPRASEAHAGLPTRTEIEKLLLAFDVPGLAIATLSNCRLEGVTGYGVADLETRAPIRAETAFEAASLSKPVFAYLVLQLVDEGMIGLDEPIASSFPYPRIADGEAYGRITPRMVLAHRTGLPNWVGDSDDPDRTDPIAFKARPGSVYAYSGEAYELLRAYVERVSGASLNQLFQDRLGAWMPHSSFAPPLPEGAEASRGYRSAKDPESGRGMTNLRDRGGAAGGLVTTAADYGRFVALACRGEGLSPALRDAMLEPQSPVPAGEYPAPTSWALGWGVMRMGPETIVFHGGNNDEYRSMAGFLPDTGEGFVFLANGRNGSDLIDALIERLQ